MAPYFYERELGLGPVVRTYRFKTVIGDVELRENGEGELVVRGPVRLEVFDPLSSIRKSGNVFRVEGGARVGEESRGFCVWRFIPRLFLDKAAFYQRPVFIDRVIGFSQPRVISEPEGVPYLPIFFPSQEIPYLPEQAALLVAFRNNQNWSLLLSSLIGTATFTDRFHQGLSLESWIMTSFEVMGFSSYGQVNDAVEKREDLIFNDGVTIMTLSPIGDPLILESLGD